ncbi:DMT family transporter [Entomohabitans teleogrylli]|uniref:DMT family transporter n=1 Tax=Entomohabitans teleogrylli TaxID=1384589 RepID=UPI00073D5356|nr:DMT family transporter [Entomohabitans teleogrylli]
MSLHKALDGKAAGIMTLLCVIWGIQQVAIKGAASEVAPVLQVALRSGIAAVAVWLVMRWRRQPLALSRHYWRAGVLAGTLFALEFLFVSEGLRLTSASHMAVFLYTAPAFAAIGLQWRLPEERLSLIQWLGIGVAFGGIALAFLSGDSDAAAATGSTLAGDLLGLLAGMAWGATTVVVRSSGLGNAPATHTLFFQLAAGFVLLMLYALLAGQTHFAPGWKGTSSLLFQSLVVAFASYLVWFMLLRRYLASQLGVLSFMTPVFGVLAGVWLLGEQLQPGFAGGACLILLGIVVVSGYNTLARWRQRRRGALVNPVNPD